MKKSFKAAVSAFLVAAALGLAATGAAQAQSVMKQCGDQWQTAKANNTTNGQTWQEFLKSCRANLASAPAAAPAAAPAPVATAPAAAPAGGESVMKQCGDQWKAAKANGTTNGQTWQQFLKSCRSGQTASTAPMAAPAPAPVAAPAPAPVATPAPAPVQASLPKPAPATMHPTARPTGAGEFSTESEAKARCPSDTVVWVNTKSHIYHYAGTRSYGTTKQGAYMCEADANASGDRASKSKIKTTQQ